MQECLYQNDSDRMIVLKCIGANKFYREKVVMPTVIGSKHCVTHVWRFGKCHCKTDAAPSRGHYGLRH